MRPVGLRDLAVAPRPGAGRMGGTMEIRNLTRRPLRIPLPGGRNLHLGPGQVGRIAPKALDHPPLQALVEAGEIEAIAAPRSQPKGGTGRTGLRRPEGGPRGGGIRHTGDR